MTPLSLSIRDFQAGDITSLTDLTNELGYPTTAEQMSTRMKTIAQLGNYWTFVAEYHKTVIGFIVYSL